ncbi:MAG: fibronectin type III domain-containing protein, partial [Bacteroidales bacterium]|nr:fibronectin type III domain-containing protein [Bacteroidales bacterium]
IYLAHVDTFFGSWTYDAGHRHYVTSGLTRVVNARNVTFSNSGWTEITFDSNFTYQGGQDLLVVVIDHTQQIPSLTPQFLCHSTSWLLTVHHEYNSTSNVAGTPAATSFTPNWTDNCTSESSTNYRPNIRFKISKSTCINKPTNIEYQEHPSSVDISWDANGASKWEVRYGTHGFAFPSSGTSVYVNTNSCTISGLAENTQYDFYIRSVCGSCNGEYTPAHSFVTLPSSFAACSWGIRVNIGDNGFSGGISQFDDAVPPFNTYKSYSYSQTIYTAEDFGIRGGTISGMTINQLCGGSAISLGTPLKIYIGHTDKNSFASSTDWVDPSTLQEVYSSSLSLHDGMIHIQFSTPFEYDASDGDNLVVAFYDSGAGTRTSDTEKAYYSRTASADNRTLMTVSNSSFTPCQNAATYIRQFYLSASFEICSPRPLCDYVPVSLSAENGDRQVELTWNMVSGATYKLYYGINNPPSDGWVTPQNVTSPYIVPRLTNGRTYYFSLKPTGDGTTYCADNPLSTPAVEGNPNCQ